MFNLHLRLSSSVCSLVLVASSSAAGFDFENLTASYTGSGARPGVYSSVSQTVAGLTMTVTRTQGTTFDVYGLTNADPYAGKRWLDGFNVSPERPFVLDFSAPLSAFSLFLGQFNASSSRTAVLRAYSGAGGTGALLMESSATYPTSSNAYGPFTGAFLTVNGASIGSVTASINGSFNNGFIDNGAATVAPVPEPEAMVVLGVGALSLLRRRVKGHARQGDAV